MGRKKNGRKELIIYGLFLPLCKIEPIIHDETFYFYKKIFNQLPIKTKYEFSKQDIYN